MKAMLVDENKRLVWSDVDEPVLTDDGVLVEIYAAALNRADILQKNGTYPSPDGWPKWMGLELAGKVSALGKNAEKNCKFKVGDEVCALVGGGAYAERIVIPYQLLLPVPKGLSLAEAAAIPEAYTTSYLNLFDEGRLCKGQTLYVAAGASGLASAAIPMGKAAGAYVVTSVQNGDAAKRIAGLGADYIIDQEAESIPVAFEKLANAGKPVNVCMDCLAGDDLGAALPFMADGGYWIVISTLAGVTTQISLRPLLTKGLHLVGSMLRRRSVDEKQKLLTALADKFWKFFEDGTIKPSIYKVLDITQAEQAHGILERFENTGKVVLKIRG